MTLGSDVPNSIQKQLFDTAIKSLKSKKDESAIKLLEAIKEGYLGDGMEGIDEVMIEIRDDYIGDKSEVGKN